MTQVKADTQLDTGASISAQVRNKTYSRVNTKSKLNAALKNVTAAPLAGESLAQHGNHSLG